MARNGFSPMAASSAISSSRVRPTSSRRPSGRHWRRRGEQGRLGEDAVALRLRTAGRAGFSTLARRRAGLVDRGVGGREAAQVERVGDDGAARAGRFRDRLPRPLERADGGVAVAREGGALAGVERQCVALDLQRHLRVGREGEPGADRHRIARAAGPLGHREHDIAPARQRRGGRRGAGEGVAHGLPRFLVRRRRSSPRTCRSRAVRRVPGGWRAMAGQGAACSAPRLARGKPARRAWRRRPRAGTREWIAWRTNTVGAGRRQEGRREAGGRRSGAGSVKLCETWAQGEPACRPKSITPRR